MKPVKLHVPHDLQALLDHLISMLISAPTFIDKTGYFPYLTLDHVFRELNEGLAHNRQTIGEERYLILTQMSDQMRVHFEADPEDNTGETLQGCKIIHAMEEILREARRNP